MLVSKGCPTCHGSGKKVVGKDICYSCGGTGRGGFMGPCPVCKGNGWVKREAPCTDCHGSGRIWVEEKAVKW